jgi:hypothetical protein
MKNMCNISFFEFSVITMWLRKLWWMGCFFSANSMEQYFAGLKINMFSILGIRRVIHHVFIQHQHFFSWYSHEIPIKSCHIHGFAMATVQHQPWPVAMIGRQGTHGDPPGTLPRKVVTPRGNRSCPWTWRLDSWLRILDDYYSWLL